VLVFLPYPCVVTTSVKSIIHLHLFEQGIFFFHSSPLAKHDNVCIVLQFLDFLFPFCYLLFEIVLP
jgi:hypothetical protein